MYNLLNLFTSKKLAPSCRQATVTLQHTSFSCHGKIVGVRMTGYSKVANLRPSPRGYVTATGQTYNKHTGVPVSTRRPNFVLDIKSVRCDAK